MTSHLTTHADIYPMFVYLDSPVDQDAPTVADYTPFATAQTAEIAPAVTTTKIDQKTYGELWKAWAHTTGSYPEM